MKLLEVEGARAQVAHSWRHHCTAPFYSRIVRTLYCNSSVH